MIELIDCKFISDKKYLFFSSNRVHVIPILIIIAILFEPFRRLIIYSSLDFGGKDSFYCNTVSQITKYFLHDYTFIDSYTLIIARIILTIITLFPTVIILYKIFQKNKAFFDKYKGLIISNFLTVLISSAIILQHIIFKSDFPINRFSIFLLPVLIIQFGFFAIYLLDYYKKIITVTLICLALISCISFAFRADLHSCSEWKYDSETKNMIKKLTKYHGNYDPDNADIKLGTNWLFEPTINFYRYTKNLSWLLPVDRNGAAPDCDYYYVFKEDLDKLNPDSYYILYEFNRTNTFLLKKKNTP